MQTPDPFDLRWTQAEALELCRRIEELCPAAGCHVALTGGLLYKDGPRKDCDLLFYRIRQTPNIEVNQLFKSLKTLGFKDIRGFGWCYQATVNGKPVDLFFPEESMVIVSDIPSHKNNVKTY